MPWAAVWDYFCLQQRRAGRHRLLDEIKAYESELHDG